MAQGDCKYLLFLDTEFDGLKPMILFDSEEDALAYVDSIKEIGDAVLHDYARYEIYIRMLDFLTNNTTRYIPYRAEGFRLTEIPAASPPLEPFLKEANGNGI